MKHFNKLFATTLLFVGLASQAQDKVNPWAVSFGANAVDTRVSASRGGLGLFEKTYSQGLDIKDNWKQCDVWITDNKKIIDLIPENKTGIKFNTTYNQFFTYGKEISKLIEINEPWLKSLEKTTTLTLMESQRNVEQEEQSQTKTELK